MRLLRPLVRSSRRMSRCAGRTSATRHREHGAERASREPRATEPRPRTGRPDPDPRPTRRPSPTPSRRRADADGWEPERPAVQAGQPDAVPAHPVRTPAPGPDHGGRHDRRRRAGRTAQPRAAADPRHGAGGPGDPRLVQRPGRPQARRPPPAHRQAARRRPARPRHGVVLPGPRGLPGGAAVGGATGSTPGRRTSSRSPSACSASGSGCARASSRGCRGRRRTRSTRRSSPTAAGAARRRAPRPSCSSPGWPRCSGSACTC